MAAEWYVHQGVWVLTYNTESTVDGFVSLTGGARARAADDGRGGGRVTGGYDEMARRRIRLGNEGRRRPWPEVEEEERVVEQEATPSRFARAAQHNIAAT